MRLAKVRPGGRSLASDFSSTHSSGIKRRERFIGQSSPHRQRTHGTFPRSSAVGEKHLRQCLVGILTEPNQRSHRTPPTMIFKEYLIRVFTWWNGTTSGTQF